MKRISVVLLYVLLSVLLLTCKQNQDPVVSSSTPPDVFGVKEPTAEELKQGIVITPILNASGRTDVPKSTTLPAEYDLHLAGLMPPPGSQKQQGSCVAWAVGYTTRSYYYKRYHKESYLTQSGTLSKVKVFSPAYIYNQLNGGKDDGISIPGALLLLQKEGVCTEDLMPYNYLDYTTQPSNEAKTKAALFKIQNYGYFNPPTVLGIKQQLYYDNPVIVSISLDEDTWNFEPVNQNYVWRTFGKFKGSHAMVIVGYSDTMKAFKLQNEYGTGWKNNGFVWLAYDNLSVIKGAYVMYATDVEVPSKTPKVTTSTPILLSESETKLVATLTNDEGAAIIDYGFITTTAGPSETGPRTAVNKPVNSNSFNYDYSYKTTLPSKIHFVKAYAKTSEGKFVYSTALPFVPSANTLKGFKIDNFSSPPYELVEKRGAKIDGTAVDLSHNSAKDGISSGYVGPDKAFDITNGFETTFEFSGTKATGIDVGLYLYDRTGYRPFGLDFSPTQTYFNIGWSFAQRHTYKTLPSMLDGKRHKVKVVIKNTVSGTVGQCFVDDLNTPAFDYETSGQNVVGYLNIYNEIPYKIPVIQAFSNPVGPVDVKIHYWEFKAY